MYDQVITNLLEFYNSDVERRDSREYPAWKREERQHFLSLLQQEGKTSLLEIGAGTGKDSQFFQQHGLKVTSTDLSPEMVKRQEVTRQFFTLLYFKRVHLEDEGDLHFQSMILRRS